MYQMTNQELLDINGGAIKASPTIPYHLVKAISWAVNSVIKLFK